MKFSRLSGIYKIIKKMLKKILHAIKKPINKSIALIALFLLFLIQPGMARGAVMIEDVQGGNIYHLSVDYDNENYTIREVSLVRGIAPDWKAQPETGFRCDTVSFNDEILDSFMFSDPTILCADNFSEDGSIISGGCEKQEKGNFSLEIPYYSDAKNINIYDEDERMIVFADVSNFAKRCGDGVCQENENYGICPADCRSGIRDGYCDRVTDGVCDSDCFSKEDPDCSIPFNWLPPILWIVAFIFLVFVIGYFWKKMKKSDAQQ